MAIDQEALRCGACADPKAVEEFIELVLLRKLRGQVETMLRAFDHNESYPYEGIAIMRQLVRQLEEAD